ncbi:MAG: hypothetical protein Q7T26_03425 [Dehalococcoidia bacterium]|nr:hypothetical protein [Dehalococcoidia bacterium]
MLLETNGPNAPGVWSVAGQPRVVLMPMFVQEDAPPVPSPEASPTNHDVTEASEESENGESATLREEGESEIPE